MKRYLPLLLASSCLLNFALLQAQNAKLDTAAIERTTGLSGKLNAAEGVFKVSAPRTDVPVMVDRWKMPPFMGLTSWAAFQPSANGEAMVMGDLVLFEDEVNPVMSAVFQAGLEVTALHNHFFFDKPKVYFMHISGHGQTDTLARGVRAALDKVKELRAAQQEPAETFGALPLPAQSTISSETLGRIIGTKGESKDGMFKVVIGRKAQMQHGGEVGKEMGVNTWAAFAGSDENAVVDGDFVVREAELQNVLKTLRHGGINIVAIHHHMTHEEPRMIFLHYWGRGKAEALAQSIKAALAVQRD